MNEALLNIQRELESLNRVVGRVRAKHVNAKPTKEAVKTFIHRYFSELRAALLGDVAMAGEVARVDAEMQELLRLTQRRAPVADYRSTLKKLIESASSLELLIASPPTKAAPLTEPHHARLLDSLNKVCPTAGASFEQGLCDLRAKERKSWRGTAVEFREALREVLDTLAPDDDVTKQPGFKLEPDTKGPTMKQKVVFILRSRRPKDPQIKTLSDAISVIDELVGKLVRSVYTRSSVGVHVQTSRGEAVRIRDYVSLILGELLEVSK